MPRMRTLKPETFTSETLSLASVPARWTFAGLWTYCDDDGRGKADPRLIKAAIWPLDDDVTAKDVAGHLDELEALELLCRYEHGGRGYVHVVNFAEHQRPNRPVPSKLPECCKDKHGGFGEVALDPHGALTEGSVSAHGGLTATSFTNVTTPSATCTGVGDGEVDGEVVPFTSENASRSSDANEGREDVDRVCSHLADRIAENGSPRPRVTRKWRDAARLLMDKDRRTEQQVHAAIDWCQNHEFWRSNVMSMPKLREQYDQMRLQAEAQRGRNPPGGGLPRSTTDDRVAATQALKAKFGSQPAPPHQEHENAPQNVIPGVVAS